MITYEWLEGDFTVSDEGDGKYYLRVFDNRHWSGAALDGINRNQLEQIRDAIDYILTKQ